MLKFDVGSATTIDPNKFDEGWGDSGKVIGKIDNCPLCGRKFSK